MTKCYCDICKGTAGGRSDFISISNPYIALKMFDDKNLTPDLKLFLGRPIDQCDDCRDAIKEIMRKAKTDILKFMNDKLKPQPNALDDQRTKPFQFMFTDPDKYPDCPACCKGEDCNCFDQTKYGCHNCDECPEEGLQIIYGFNDKWFCSMGCISQYIKDVKAGKL